MRPFIYIFLLMVALACSGTDRHTCFIHVDNEKWGKEDMLEKEFILTAAGEYELYLCVRHNSDYGYRTLNCALSLWGEHGGILQDTLSIPLESAKHIRITEYPTGKRIRTEGGRFRIRIGQLSQDPCLEGIRDIGLRFEIKD